MREILFRGKNRCENQWVYGAYSLWDYSPEAESIIIDTSIIDYNDDCLWVRVIPETVGQYTGLTDKDGKKIFEGDILEFSDRLVIVFWHTHLGCWDSKFLKFTNKDNSRDDMSPPNWEYKSNVVGNIHDNPELLEGGGE